MYAFSFKHKLLFHKEGPSPRAAPRELRYSDRNKILTSGADCVEEKTGQGEPGNYQFLNASAA
jgi:hypothetical protein